MNPTIRVAIVDDHILARGGVKDLLREHGKYEVVLEAQNGRDLIDQLQPGKLPDICLLDISMPVMDGYETCAYLKEHFPSIKVIALSVYHHESNIIRMIRNGARGYLIKDLDPASITQAIQSVLEHGYYHTDLTPAELYSSVLEGLTVAPQLTDKELTFLKYCCQDLTYSAIADKLCVSKRTVDNYRESLFRKIGTNSKVGLVIYAFKIGLEML